MKLSVTLQLLPSVYVMFAVPALTPVTTPVELTVAAALSLLQVPDSPLPVSVLVNPLQTDSVPEIVGGA